MDFVLEFLYVYASIHACAITELPSDATSTLIVGQDGQANNGGERERSVAQATCVRASPAGLVRLQSQGDYYCNSTIWYPGGRLHFDRRANS